MAELQHDPPFGAADLSNCERELIHLAGSVQPHGALLVLREPELSILQASENTADALGIAHAALAGGLLDRLGGDLAEQVSASARSNLLKLPQPLRCRIERDGVSMPVHVLLHRQAGAGLIVELEPVGLEEEQDGLAHLLAEAVGTITAAPTLSDLTNEVVQRVRAMTGYDRVMVYRFDEDGHGEVIAETREDALEPFLGQHYPASDIPQRARELYVRNRVRQLVDVRYEPVAIHPRVSPVSGQELDMSLCSLRSMSPMHLQYLQNMGVTATLVASLVREGRLWGLIACHHYSVKRVTYEVRAACELISEIVSTRIAALENRAQVEAELFVRALERDLVTAATETGDWRDAIFSEPESRLLGPMDASGAVLFYEGEVLTAGETPSIPELRALAAWLEDHALGHVFQSASLPKLNPEFAAMASVATGILVAELSRADGEFLVWFRKEQVRTVTWAGNPDKPVAVGNDPRDLSPRRSFAAWSELVRHTAKAWTPTELAIAGAMQGSLMDVILQMRALRALIAERQATATLDVIGRAGEPMIIADGSGSILLVNDAFHRLAERPMSDLRELDDLPMLFEDDGCMRAAIRQMRDSRRAWRGEMKLIRSQHSVLHVAMRGDPVPGLRGDVLGYIFLFTDIQRQREARALRARIERVIAESEVQIPFGGAAAVLRQDFEQLLSAIVANASAAMTQIADTSVEPATGALLEELEAATRRAADLTSQILGTLSRARRSV